MNVLETVVRRLREAGPRRWDAIATATEIPISTVRKIAYHDLKNPTIGLLQPLLDFFDSVDRKQRPMPPEAATQKRGRKPATEGL